MELPRARTYGRATPWVLVVVCAIAVGIPPIAILPLLLGIGLTGLPAAASAEGVAAVESANDSGTGTRTADAEASPSWAGGWQSAPEDLSQDPRQILRDHLRVARSAADVPFALPLARAPCC